MHQHVVCFTRSVLKTELQDISRQARINSTIFTIHVGLTLHKNEPGHLEAIVKKTRELTRSDGDTEEKLTQHVAPVFETLVFPHSLTNEQEKLFKEICLSLARVAVKGGLKELSHLEAPDVDSVGSIMRDQARIARAISAGLKALERAIDTDTKSVTQLKSLFKVSHANHQMYPSDPKAALEQAQAFFLDSMHQKKPLTRALLCNAIVTSLITEQAAMEISTVYQRLYNTSS
jgi:hypothetical protein